jgi:hypothetical protein
MLMVFLITPPLAPPEVPPVGVGVGEEVLEGRTEEGVEVGGFVVVVVITVEEVVILVVVVVGVTEETVELPEREEEPEGETTELEEAGQSVDEPGWTVKGADCEEAPVLSRSNSPRLVPAETGTTQVNEVPVRLSQE